MLYRRREQVALRRVAGAHLLVPLTTAEQAVYTLNRTGARLWQQLECEASATTLATKLQKEYTGLTLESAQRDVDHFLAEMVALGLVAVMPEGTA